MMIKKREIKISVKIRVLKNYNRKKNIYKLALNKRVSGHKLKLRKNMC